MPRIPRSTLLFVSVVLIAAVISNLMYEYREASSQAYAVGAGGQRIEEVGTRLPTICMAGFPRTFCVQTKTPNTPTQTTSSILGLLFNVFCWSALAAAVFVYEIYMARKGDGRRRVSLLDLMVVTLFVGGFFAYWQQLGRTFEKYQDIQQEVFASGGAVEKQTLLPRVVANWIPWFALERFETIQAISLTSPSPELVAEVVTLPMLQDLSLKGKSFPAELIDTALRNPMLCRLEIAGRRLSNENVASICGAAGRLQWLHLKRTNISIDGLIAMGEAPRLTSLDLVKTGVDLTRINELSIRSNLEEISLPHPDPGEAAHCNLSGWPKLRVLKCFEDDVLTNETPMVLQVSDMPQLQSIDLDVLQSFELTVRNAPELAAIRPLKSQVETRVSTLDQAPANLWISQFRGESLPKLSELDVFAGGLSNFRTQNCPSLQLAIRNRTFGEAEVDDSIPRETIQSLLDTIAGLSLQSLTLENLDLRGVTLSAWRGSANVRELHFDGCIAEGELSTLSEAPGLEVLRFDRMPVSSKLHTHLVTSLPNLSHCLVDELTVTELAMQDCKRLESVLGEQIYPVQPALRRVRLQNMRRFRDTIDLVPGVEECVLVNAPAMQGFSFRMPLPAGSQLSGFRDLEYFAGGGAIIDKVLLSEIVSCKPLRRLSLAYCDVNEESLFVIEQATNLEELMLYGCEVTDKFVDRVVPRLSQLKRLDLRRTNITSKSLPKILSSLELESLFVSGTEASKGDWSQLAGLNDSLKHLGIGGARIDLELATLVGRIDQLETLDISGSTLEQDAVEHLTATIADSLERLVAREIEGKVSLNALAMSAQSIDLSGAQIDPRSLDWIVENRYVDLDGPPKQILDDVMSSILRRMYGDSELPVAGEIDPELFSPTLAPATRELLASHVMMTNMQLRQSNLVDYASYYTESLEYAGQYEQSIVLDSTTYGAGTYGGDEYESGVYAGPLFYISPWEWLGYQLGEQLKVRRTLEEF